MNVRALLSGVGSTPRCLRWAARRRPTRGVAAGALAVLVVTTTLLFAPAPTSAVQIASGVVDNSSQTGPRWTSMLFTP